MIKYNLYRKQKLGAEGVNCSQKGLRLSMGITEILTKLKG